MDIKLIKTETDYERALERVDELMDADSSTGDELELLTTLIELYEEQTDPIELPDPIEAIRFRMDQSGLRQKDLIPLIGSRPRVSEVLNRKRPLTLKMIRALHAGLGIPAEVLLQKPNATLSSTSAAKWERFPIVEMAKRGWFREFTEPATQARDYAEELMTTFLGTDELGFANPSLFKQHIRSGSEMDEHALTAWLARVLQIATEQVKDDYDIESLRGALSSLIQLSYLDEGPRLAQEYLSKFGVALVVLQHLPGTHLDGAALFSPAGYPVIALTLRHDRLDNFWFTLMHELGHVILNFGPSADLDMYVDDLNPASNEIGQVETDADAFAESHLIPEDIWLNFRECHEFTSQNVHMLAEELRISPAIVAGRIRRDTRNYRRFTPMVGYRTVRRMFENFQGSQNPV